MKVVLAGAGAFGKKHLDGIRNIDGVECVSSVVNSQPPRPLQRLTEFLMYAPTLQKRWSNPTWMRPYFAHRHRCMPRRRSSAWRRASTCRWKFRSQIRWLMHRRSSQSRRKRALLPCVAIRDDSIHRISGYTTKSGQVNSASSKWTYRLIFFAART